MTDKEYEQKKRECWEEYKRENLDGEVQWQPISRYDVFCAAFDRAYALGKQETNQEIKQETDAEGEEMLTVSAITVREMYAANERIKNDASDNELGRTSDHINHVLRCLFGPKCLLDDTKNDTKEPKPAEPKFNLGDIVRFKYCCTTYRIDGFKMSDGVMLYQVGEVWAEESDLEPYTEPKEDTAENRNWSQNCGNCAESVQKTYPGFGHLRLTIAAQMMQGLICAPLIPGVDPNPPAENLAQTAFRLADALLAEWRKD